MASCGASKQAHVRNGARRRSTAVGVVQAALNRISAGLVDLGREPMSRRASGIASAITLVLAIVISRVGIVDLVANGYTAAAWGMLIIFGVPLLIRGAWLIAKGSPV